MTSIEYSRWLRKKAEEKKALIKLERGGSNEPSSISPGSEKSKSWQIWRQVSKII